MAEKNDYADAIVKAIRRMKNINIKNPEEEVLVIQIRTREGASSETEIKISEKDLPILRELLRKVDEPDNKVKIIVSNMMLREGWDVQNVTVVLGLRPFTSKAQILPEQAVGRGLRLMRGISPDHTQTFEVMSTQAFEEFVKELEKEGVGINTVKTPPPVPVTITPEKSRKKYDIEIPQTDFRYSRNYRNIEDFNPENVNSLYNSDILEEQRKIQVLIEFASIGTQVGTVRMPLRSIMTGRELISTITNEVMKKAKFTCDFHVLYPKIKTYILKKCFEVEIDDVENESLRNALSDLKVQEAIIDLLAKELSKISLVTKNLVLKNKPFKLSEISEFICRRKHLTLTKTIFNFVAVYNDYEAEFARFLDKAPDIEKFAALADKFYIDYISTRGAIRLYNPDFVAVQKVNKKVVYWIIETKGREFEDIDKKDAAMKKWCEDVSKQTGQNWNYLKIFQYDFNLFHGNIFQELVDFINMKGKKKLN